MVQHNVGEAYQDSRSPEDITFEPDLSIDALAETLVALANSRGGTLLLKLDDSELEEAIAEGLDRLRAAALRAEPVLILPLPAMMDATTLGVNVPPGLSHVFALDGRFLARDGLANRALTPRELRRLLIERADLNYEEELAIGATLDDLNWRAVEAYATRIGGSDALSVLSQRGCVARGSGESGWTPTHAGLLLFRKDPQRYIRGAFITAVRFAGVQISDTFSRQDISGTLSEQIFPAETCFLGNLRRGIPHCR